MPSGDMRWALWQWAIAILVVLVPFSALSLGANPMLFPGILLLLAGCVFVFGVWTKPPERRSGLLLTIVLLGAVFWSLSAKVFLSARPAPPSTICLSNVKQEALCMLLYAADYDDRFPLAESWHTATRPYVRAEHHCPEATAPWSYAMNRQFSSELDPELPGVLLFEADAALPNASGGREWLVFRHEERAVIGFTDGSARRCRPDEAATLNW